MPNTLAHLGVQALITRSLIRKADEKWIYVGAVLPDVGWILQRAAQRTLPGADAFDLRLYATVQTSLLVTLLLAAGVSLFTRRWRLTFAILALNAVLHLLLDACEIKWGNGVLLFAPFSWDLMSWGRFWPDAWPAQVLTVVGLAYVIATLRRAVTTPLGLCWPSPLRAVLAAVLVSAYLVLPWVLREGPLGADAHYVQSLRDPALRADAYVEFDRERFRPDAEGGTLEFFAPPPVRVTGIDLSRPATVSIRGRFIDERTLEVLEYYEHRGVNRDMPTVLGLVLVLGIVAAPWLMRRLSDARSTRSL
jgi:hypothetical protein